jgi:predicted kinase
MNDATLYLTVGLPQSGKTTWARAFSRQHGAPIVNPDSIRLALHGQPFIAQAEPFVWAIAKVMVAALFLAGHEIVIVDATNISRRRRDEWKSPRWERAFKGFETDPAECKRRAVENGRDDLLPVIDRMMSEYEPLSDDE